MTNKEKERELDMGLMRLLYFCNEYFSKVDNKDAEREANIYRGLMKKQTKQLVELLERKEDNIIQFPELRK